MPSFEIKPQTHKRKADKNAVTKYSAQKTRTLSGAQFFSPCAHSGEKKKTFGRPPALVNVKVKKRLTLLTLSTTAEKKLIMAVIYDQTLKKAHFNDLAKINT